MDYPRGAVEIGRATRRAIIVLYLTPEDAEDMANEYGPSDLASGELIQAARVARISLGEPVADAPLTFSPYTP